SRRERFEELPQARRLQERPSEAADKLRVDHHRTPPETAAVVVLAEAHREAAIFITKQLNGGLAPFPDRGRFFDDLAHSPWHPKRPRDLARRSLHIGKC